MKKILFIAFVLGLVASSASAHEMAKRTALGFIDSSTPIGIRHWFGPKLGLDVGFGISSTQQETSPGTKTTYTDYQVSVGLPINLLSVGDRVNMHLLPMFEYRTIDQGTDNETQYDIIGALEFEVFVTKDLSVSASQGIVFTSANPPGTAESTSDWTTFGSNITQFGVHYYLPGGGGGGGQ